MNVFPQIIMLLIFTMFCCVWSQSNSQNEKIMGKAFGVFWTESKWYTEKDDVQKRFRWRRLMENEIDGVSGTIKESIFPQICNARDSDVNSMSSKWRLIEFADINGPAFQMLIDEITDFGSYRLDGRVTLQHRLVMQYMKTVNSGTSTVDAERLIVVLTVGGERRDFQIDVYPRSRSRGRVVPTDIVCVSSDQVSVATLDPPSTLRMETATRTQSRSTNSADNIYMVDCNINNSAAVASGVFDGHLTSLDAFLVRHRAAIFVLTISCVTMLVLVIVLLLCLVVRYRALRRTAKSEKNQIRMNEKILISKAGRTLPTKISVRETTAVDNSSYSDNNFLCRKKSSPSAIGQLPTNYGIKSTGCCDESSADFSTCKRHRNHQMQHQHSPHFSPTHCSHEANKSLPPLPVCAGNVDLGVIAARRALKASLRSNTVPMHTSSNGAIYSSLDTNGEHLSSASPHEDSRVTTFDLV